MRKTQSAQAGLIGKQLQIKKRSRRAIPKQRFITDPKTIEIVNKLRETLQGPVWFYTMPREGDDD
jgi:hypothetical protein